jgi:ceramide glucosyltransferase
VITLLLLAIAGWAFVACVFTGVALKALGIWHRAAVDAVATIAARGGWPKISIWRPCEGLDPGLEVNLIASATARYDGPREVFVCVPSERDPSYAVAERARAEVARRAPDVPFSVVVTRIETTQNRKAAHLAVVEGRTDAPICVVADSDVHLEDDSLPALVAAIEADPQAGASFSPPVDVTPATLGDRASAALLSSTPHALLALASLSAHNGTQTLLAGALLACRRDVLGQVGGFAALEPYLGEDFELARRLHELGRPVRVSASPAWFTDQGRSVRAIVARYARWSMVVKRQRSLLFTTYFTLLGCTPALVLATAALALVRWPAAVGPAILVGVLLVLRTALALGLRRRYRVDGGVLAALFAMLLGEALIFAAAAEAAFRSRIIWRGRPFRVGARGELEAISA